MHVDVNASWSFPEGFFWGVSSASYQVEGAAKEEVAARASGMRSRIARWTWRIIRQEMLLTMSIIHTNKVREPTIHPAAAGLQ